MRKLASERVGSEVVRLPKNSSGLVARRGARGEEVTPTLGRFRRKDETNKGRKKARKKGKHENLKI